MGAEELHSSGSNREEEALDGLAGRWDRGRLSEGIPRGLVAAAERDGWDNSPRN